MRIALIQDDTVLNIAEFDATSDATEFAAQLGYIAVPVDDLPVVIGDKYIGGEFYRDGEKVVQIFDNAAGIEMQFLKDCIMELAEKIYGE